MRHLLQSNLSLMPIYLLDSKTVRLLAYSGYYLLAIEESLGHLVLAFVVHLLLG